MATPHMVQQVKAGMSRLAPIELEESSGSDDTY